MAFGGLLRALMLAAVAGLHGASLAVDVHQHGRADEEQLGLKFHPAVAAADWSSPQEIVVELEDDTYRPSEIQLTRGRPYLMRLKNIGGSAHDMAGGTFFGKHVIALRAVASRIGRITADDVSSIYIRPKQETELWFVPIRTGRS